MISEGRLTFTIVTKDFKSLVEQCQEFKNDGYYIESCDTVTNWPYFWSQTFKAVMIKRYVMDTDTQDFAILPENLI